MKEKNILIITDNKGKLFNKYIGKKEEHKRGPVDIEKIEKNFREYGYKIIVASLGELDLKRNYKDYFVLYTSSEARGGFYKEYIEDVLLRLNKDGAVLIPSFYFFRAHHNKIFQEMLRKQFGNSQLCTPDSFTIGDYEDAKSISNKLNYPIVVKMARGSGSSGVVLVKNSKQFQKDVYNMMKIEYKDFHDAKGFLIRNNYFIWICKEFVKKLLGMKKTNRQSNIIASNPIIVQEYIANLKGDYKVLFFSGHYYVLYRKNRDDDFRASGSGKFIFPSNLEDIDEILNYAEMVAEEINMPCISMDIAQNEDGCFLIEYQCVYFGNYTMQFAEWYFERENEEWIKKNSGDCIEDEYCRAIDEYIKNYKEDN